MLTCLDLPGTYLEVVLSTVRTHPHAMQQQFIRGLGALYPRPGNGLEVAGPFLEQREGRLNPVRIRDHRHIIVLRKSTIQPPLAWDERRARPGRL